MRTDQRVAAIRNLFDGAPEHDGISRCRTIIRSASTRPCSRRPSRRCNKNGADGAVFTSKKDKSLKNVQGKAHCRRQYSEHRQASATPPWPFLRDLSQLAQQGFRVRHFKLAALLDVQLRHDAIVDQHRVAGFASATVLLD